MKTFTWRDKARQTIDKVCRETGEQDLEKLRKALFDAYPFGARENYPYRVWLEEVSARFRVIEASKLIPKERKSSHAAKRPLPGQLSFLG